MLSQITQHLTEMKRIEKKKKCIACSGKVYSYRIIPIIPHVSYYPIGKRE